MSGKSFNMQANECLSGSGASSHVYVPFLPLKCRIPGSSRVYYDDGAKLLIIPTSNQVYYWKTVPFSPYTTPNIDSISEGPILSIRYSLDLKLIAIQRSDREIQLWLRDAAECFSHCCEDSETILGFFWTDCSLCDLVVVKTSGVDMLACDAQSKLLYLVERKKSVVNWYIYTHESRLLLLASGLQCKSFSGFQMSSAGIVRLPKFNMAMAKSEEVKKPVLAAEDVYIVTIYGRIYCLQHDRVAMLLHSYRFFRDAVIQQGSFPVYSKKIAVSVVDNVLLVHQVDAKVAILYDLHADSRAPISAPLPLLFRGFPRSNSSSSRSSGRDLESSESQITDCDSFIYADSWMFLVPDLICDAGNLLLWKLHLDLEAVSSSSSDVPFVLEFLQRRRLEAAKAKELCVALTRTMILERRPTPLVARAIDVLITSFSSSFAVRKGSKLEADARNTTSIERQPADADGNDANPSSIILSGDSEDESHFGSLRNDAAGAHSARKPRALVAGIENREVRLSFSPAVSLEELYTFVFAHVEEEMAGEPAYMMRIIVELLRSANLEKMKVPPNVYVLAAQLLARNDRYAELSLYITSKVLEPSREVAMQLMESGRQDGRVRKLGLDMLRQLSLHHDYVVSLAQDGHFMEALRYARKHMVVTVRASLFLEVAVASSSAQVLASVLRFFCDYTPGFRDTIDFHTYFRILSDMNSAS